MKQSYLELMPEKRDLVDKLLGVRSIKSMRPIER